MKIGIISDIHGNDVAFEAVVRDLEQSNTNCVVFLGDLVARGAQPQECYDRMVKLKPLVWLKGNTEYWLDDAMVDVMPTTPETILLLDYYDYMVKHMKPEAMDKLIGLKHTQSLTLGHFQGVCCHGSPRDAGEIMDPLANMDGTGVMLNSINAAFVLSGHSHKAYDTLFRGIRMVNPGSVGVSDPSNKGIAKYTLMEIGSGFHITMREVQYDYIRYERIAEDRKFPGPFTYIESTNDSMRSA